ncbi:MAG: hypothetical protein AB7U82_02825 [Blastocatellales bacterium]
MTAGAARAVIRVLLGQDRVVVLFGTALFGLIGCLLIWSGWNTLRSKRRAWVLSADIQEYLSLANAPRHLQDAYVRGKVLLINRSAVGSVSYKPNTINETINSSLPHSLQPSRQEEVGTVVLLDWKGEKVGEYRYDAPAIALSCTATVIDKALKAVIHEKTWREDPLESIEFVGGQPMIFSYLHISLSDWLKALPRK